MVPGDISASPGRACLSGLRLHPSRSLCLVGNRCARSTNRGKLGATIHSCSCQESLDLLRYSRMFSHVLGCSQMFSGVLGCSWVFSGVLDVLGCSRMFTDIPGYTCCVSETKTQPVRCTFRRSCLLSFLLACLFCVCPCLCLPMSSPHEGDVDSTTNDQAPRTWDVHLLLLSSILSASSWGSQALQTSTADWLC